MVFISYLSFERIEVWNFFVTFVLNKSDAWTVVTSKSHCVSQKPPHANTAHKHHGLDFFVAPVVDLNHLSNKQGQTAPHSHAAHRSIKQMKGKYIFDWRQTFNHSFTDWHSTVRHARARRIPGLKTCTVAYSHLAPAPHLNSIIPLNGAVQAVTLEASPLKQHVPVSAAAAQTNPHFRKAVQPACRTMDRNWAPGRVAICDGNALW